MVHPDVAQYGLDPWGLMYTPIPFMVGATITLCLRVWIRLSFSRTFWWDDWALIGSYILYVLESGCLIAVGRIQLQEGIDGPVSILGTLNFVGVAAYLAGQVLFKASMAIFFLRIVIKPGQRRLILIATAIYIVYSIGVLFLYVFQCGDPGSIDIMNPKCLDFDTITGPVIYVGASLNAIIDWIFALTPIVVVRGLQMKRRDKNSVIMLILLACSGSAVSIVRIPFVPGLDLNASFYSKQSNRIAYASTAEGSIGIIVASMATYRPLLKLIKQKMSSLSYATKEDKASETPSTPSIGGVSSAARYSSGPRALVIPDIEMDDLVPLKSDMKAPPQFVIGIYKTEVGHRAASGSSSSSHVRT